MRSTELVFVAPNGDRYVLQSDCEPVRFTLGPDPVDTHHTIPAFGMDIHPMAMVAAAAAGDEGACHVPSLDGSQYFVANGSLKQVPAVAVELQEPATIADRIAVVLKESRTLMTRDEIYKALAARFPLWWPTARKASISKTLTVNTAFKVVESHYSPTQMFWM